MGRQNFSNYSTPPASYKLKWEERKWAPPASLSRDPVPCLHNHVSQLVIEKECCLQEPDCWKGEEPSSMVEGELLLACFQQSSNYSTLAWNQPPNEECYSLSLENETPHSLVSRIHDLLGTDPAPPKLFNTEQKLLYVLYWALSIIFILLGFCWFSSQFMNH